LQMGCNLMWLHRWPQLESHRAAAKSTYHANSSSTSCSILSIVYYSKRSRGNSYCGCCYSLMFGMVMMLVGGSLRESGHCAHGYGIHSACSPRLRTHESCGPLCSVGRSLPWNRSWIFDGMKRCSAESTIDVVHGRRGLRCVETVRESCLPIQLSQLPSTTPSHNVGAKTSIQKLRRRI
jgi:hypothetical protein